MAYTLASAINELWTLWETPSGLSVNAVETAAAKCQMEVPEFLRALRKARAPLTDMFRLGQRETPRMAMDVWKGIVNLSRSSATTAEFTETVSAVSGGFLAVPPGMAILGAIGWG